MLGMFSIVYSVYAHGTIYIQLPLGYLTHLLLDNYIYAYIWAISSIECIMCIVNISIIMNTLPFLVTK